MDRILSLYELKIPIDKLEKAPQQEAAFFLRSMSILNDISVLQKAILHSIAVISQHNPNSPETRAQVAQSFCFIRILAGICYEAFDFIQLGFFANPGNPLKCRAFKTKQKKIATLKLKSLSAIFMQIMSSQAQTANKKIQDYFSKNNSIRWLRNKFSFHYNLEQAFHQLEKFKIIDDPHIFLEEMDGNCCYVLSHQLMILQALRVQKDDPNELKVKFEALIKEVTSVAHAFTIFLNSFVLVFSEKYLAIDTSTPPEVRLDGVAFLDEIQTPFFLKRRA